MLKLSTKGRYGLRAMIDLAQAEPGEPVLMAEIARRQGLSRKYLHSLLVALKNAGLVRSVRGARGGYVLARSPGSIRAREVFEALEGKLAINHCVEKPSLCPRYRSCEARKLWKAVNQAIFDVMEGVSLRELAAR
jgi:Rrf2 family cysteine metabolism transcriptional repressor